MFICSFVRLFVCSFVRLFVCSFVRLFVCSRFSVLLFICSFVRLFVCSFGSLVLWFFWFSVLGSFGSWFFGSWFFWFSVLGSQFSVLGSWFFWFSVLGSRFLERKYPMLPDLYALVLRLRPARGQPPPSPQGHGAQALFLDLVRQVDPDLAARLHADAQAKPFTVAILPPDQEARRIGALDLRATCMTADLFPPLTQALLRQMGAATLRLGATALALQDVLGTPGSHPWAGYSSFAEVAAQAQTAPLLTLHFATATAIGQGTRADGKQRLALFPTPEAIFKSLAQRWNELCPADLRVDLDAVMAAASDTLVSHHQVESCTISLGKGPQKGFVGRCTYEPPPDPAQSRLLALLADAAFYLGVGMKTARGMGACRRAGERVSG
jgi:CRISPR-associated endoribonuclease Cas6